MKKLLYFFGIAFIAFGITSCSAPAKAVAGPSKTTEEKINDQHFTFEAQEVLPMGGRTRQLSSYYGLKVAADTLESTLPYFGRAYSAPMNPSDAGYMFTSNQFDFNVTAKGADEWDISMVPKDRHNGERFLLSAFANGTASLQVSSNNRQPITFRGRIR